MMVPGLCEVTTEDTWSVGGYKLWYLVSLRLQRMVLGKYEVKNDGTWIVQCCGAYQPSTPGLTNRRTGPLSGEDSGGQISNIGKTGEMELGETGAISACL